MYRFFKASLVVICLSFSAAVSAADLIAPWATTDIGNVGIAGSASVDAGNYTLRGSGADIWNTADAFRFAYQPLSGDGDIVARVTLVGNTNAWAKAGVMIRESLASDSRHAFVALTPGNGIAFQRRTATAGTSYNTSAGNASAPTWVRLSRRGGSLQAYRSGDGVNWELVGAATVNMQMDVYAGLALTSHNNSVLNTSTFDSVSVSPYSTVLPAPWQHGDIGSVGIAGSAHYSGSTFTIQASGTDIWNTADQFHYIHQQVTGNGEIIARVSGLQANNVWAKAGVMIRDSLNAGAPHVLLALTPGNGLAFQRRTVMNEASTHFAAGTASAPVWVRLVRDGDIFYAFRSDDGIQWQFVSSISITMPPTAYFGLALTSHTNSFFASATFDGVGVSVPGPLGSLPPPWQQHDVGTVGVGGYSSYDTVNAAFTLKGSGSDVWNSVDGFQYVHQTLSGNGQLTARITNVQNTNVWAKAGIMFRETLAAGSRHVMIAATPGNGLAFQRRTVENGSSTHTALGPVTLPVWLRLIRTNNVVQALRSNDGIDFQLVATLTLPLNAQIQAGLFVTAHNNGVLNTSAFDNVSLIQSGSDTLPPVISVPANIVVEATGPSGAAVNYPPVTAVDNVTPNPTITTSHPSGSVFALGVTSVTARATDAAGNEAFASFTITVRDTTSPLVTAANLTAEAQSAAGVAVTFAVAVSDAVTANPSVIYSPASGSVFPIGVSIVSVSAADAAGNIGSASFTVTVRDTTAPLVMAANVSVEAASPDGAAVTFAATATDAVTASPALVYTPPSGSVFPIGATNVIATASDAAGNVGSATFTVTVRDTTAPVIMVGNVTAEAISAAGAPVTFVATATDAVTANPALVYTPASGSNFPLGVSNVIVTATDSAGNIGTATFTVTVSDTSKPLIGAPDVIAEATSAAGAAVNFAAVITDAVTANPVVVYTPASGSAFPLGVTKVSVTATDAAGNSSIASFNVTVRDTTAPLVTVPADITVATAGTSVPVNYPPATASDAVTPSPVITYSKASGDTFDLGDTIVQVNAADAAGNVGLGSFKITVSLGLPPTAPTILQPAGTITQQTPAFLWTPVTSAAYYELVVLDVTAGNTEVLRQNNITATTFSPTVALPTNHAYTYTVRAGNAFGFSPPSQQGSFNIQSNGGGDTTPPVISVLDAIVLEAQSPTGALVASYPVSVTDDQTANPTVLFEPPAGGNFPLGVTTVKVTAKDAAGNTSTASFLVLVQDSVAPEFTAPSDLIIEGDRIGGAQFAAPTVTATDAVTSSPRILFSQPTGSLLALGVNEIAVTALDQRNNARTKIFKIEVVDSTAPEIIAPDEVIVEATSPEGGTLDYPLLATDNCDPSPAIEVSLPPGTRLAYPSISTATIKATDASGNFSTKEVVIKVVDTTPPEFLTVPPSVITINTAKVPVNVYLPQYYHAQDLVSEVVIKRVPADSSFGAGDTPVQITATDAAGNESEPVFTIVRVVFTPPEPPGPPQPPVQPEPHSMELLGWNYNANPWNRTAVAEQILTAQVRLSNPTPKRLQNAFRYSSTGIVRNDPAKQRFKASSVLLRRTFIRPGESVFQYSEEFKGSAALPDENKAGDIAVEQKWGGTFYGIDVPPGAVEDHWSLYHLWTYEDFSSGVKDPMGNPVANGSFSLLLDQYYGNPIPQISVGNYAMRMDVVVPTEVHVNGLPMATSKRPLIRIAFSIPPDGDATLGQNYYGATIVTNGGTADITFSRDLDDGTYGLAVTAKIPNGPAHTVLIQFEVETEGPSISLEPTIPIVGPAYNSTYNGATLDSGDNSPLTSMTLTLNGSTASRNFNPEEGIYGSDLGARGAFVEGTNILYGTATNMYGNSSSNSFTFQYDSTPPSASNFLPVDGSSVTITRPTISALMTDEIAGINTFDSQVYLDGQAYDGVINQNGFSFTPSQDLADGQHFVEVYVSDSIYNSTRYFWSFYVKAQPPVLLVKTSSPSRVFQPSALIDGLVSSDAVTFRVTSGSVPGTDIQVTRARNSGLQAFSAKIENLTPGYHTFNIEAVDAKGNQVSEIVSIEYSDGPDSDGDGIPDSTDAQPDVSDYAPRIFWNRPQSGDVFKSGSVQIDALISDDSLQSSLQVTLVVNGQERPLTHPDGRVVSTQILSDGQYILNIHVRDGLGRDVFAGDRLIFVDSSEVLQIHAAGPTPFTIPEWSEVSVVGNPLMDVGVIAMYPADEPEAKWRSLGVSPPPSTSGTSRWLLEGRPDQFDEISMSYNPYFTDMRYVNGTAVSATGRKSHYSTPVPATAPIRLKSDSDVRIAIQKGDTILVTGEVGKYVSNMENGDPSTFEHMRVIAPGSHLTQPLETALFDFYTRQYYAAKLLYPSAGKGFGIDFTILDEIGRTLGTAQGTVDVFDVRLDAIVDGQLLGFDAKHKGVKMNLDLRDDDGDGVDNLSDDQINVSNPNLIHLILPQPTIGTVGQGSVPAHGKVRLLVCAAGAARGLGDAQLWYDANNDGQLMRYNGDEIDVSMIPVEGLDFYLQAISPSAVERDVSVLLEFEPDEPSGSSYTYKKICRDAVWVQRINGIGLLADANHDGTIDHADRVGKDAIHGVLVASGFELPSQPRLSERVPLRIIGGLDVASGELVELTWQAPGVRIYDSPTSGSPYTGNRKIWLPGELLPRYLFLEMDRDREVNLNLGRWESPAAPWKFQQIEASKVTVVRLSHGIGGDDGIAAHAEIVPGFASVGLVRGNLHVSAVAKDYSGPALSPDVVVSFDQMDGLVTGVGEGWRTNYDVRLFDSSPDTNENKKIDPSERQKGDLLGLVDEIGRRHLLTYNPSNARFESRATTGLVSGFVDVESSAGNPVLLAGDNKRYAYRLTRLDNRFLFFSENGRLARIEDIRGQALKVSRNALGEANFVADSYERVEQLRGGAFFLPVSADTVKFEGRQLPPLQFQFNTDMRITNITALGLAVASSAPSSAPTSANGSNNYALSYNSTSGRVERVDLTSNFYMEFGYDNNATLEGAKSVDVRQYLGGTYSYTIDPIRDAWTALHDPSTVNIVRTIRPKDRRLMSEVNGRRSETYDYHVDGQLKSSAVSGGVSLTYAYESLSTPGVSLVSAITQAGIGSTNLQYFSGNLKGLLRSSTNAVSDTTEYSYELLRGFPSTTTDPRGMVWKVLTRNQYGQPTYSLSPEKRVSIASYEADGQLSETTDAMSYTTTYSYDSMRRVTLVLGPGGVNSQRQLDTFGRPWQQLQPSGLTTTTVFDPIGRPLFMSSSDIAPVTMVYDDNAGDNVYEVTATRATRLLSRDRVDFAGRQLSTAIPSELTAGAGTVEVGSSYAYTTEGWLETTTDAIGKNWTTEYDTAGRAKLQRTPLGRKTETVYKPQTNWVHKQIDADNLETSYEIDAIGRTTKTTNSKLGFVRYNFVKGLLVSVEPSLGRGESYTYDKDALPSTKTDQLNKTTVTTYDMPGRKIKSVYDNNLNRTTVTSLDGRGFAAEIDRIGYGKMQMEYRNDGTTTAVTPPARGKSRISIDSLDRVTSRYQQLSANEEATASTSFDTNTGFVTQSTNVLGLKSTPQINASTGEIQKAYDDLTENPAVNSNFKVLLRDARGMTLQYEDGEKRIWTMTYDDDGRKKTLTSPGTPSERVVTEWIYANGGASNRLQSMKRNNDTWTFGYDELNNVNLQIAPGNPPIASSAVYDEMGKLTSETVGPLTTVYNYDTNTQLLVKKTMPSDEMYLLRDGYGRVRTVHDKRAENMTVMDFDDFDRPTFTLHPDSKFESFSYVDVQGNPQPDLQEHIDRQNRTTRFERDLAGRVTRTVFENDEKGNPQAASYGYNKAGQVVSETFNNSTLSRSFDGRMRLNAVGNVAMEYYNDNKIKRKSWPDASLPGQQYSLNYLYKAQSGHLDRVISLDGPAVFAHDNRGRVSNVSLPGGVERSYKYDGADRQTLMTQRYAGKTERFAWRYDGASRIRSIADAKGAVNYSYEGQRLSSETRSGSDLRRIVYGYDNSGNRSSVNEYVATQHELGFDGPALPPELTVLSGTWTANGTLAASANARARLTLAPDAGQYYAVSVQLSTSNLLAGEQRVAGISFAEQANTARIVAGLVVTSGTNGLEARLRVQRVTDAGTVEVLGEGDPFAYDGGAHDIVVHLGDDGVTLSLDEGELTEPVAVALEATAGTLGLESTQGAVFDSLRWQSFSQNAPQTLAYNSINQILGPNHDYNAAGHLTREMKGGVEWQYKYDRLDRLESATANGVTRTYSYAGASWMRTGITEGANSESFVYDGFACVSHNQNGAQTNYFTPGGSALFESSGGTVTSYLQDGLGNIAARGTNNAVTERYDYTAFGDMRARNALGQTIARSNGPRYRGEWHDAVTDQHYLRNRQYDPKTGRFLTLDPKGMVDGPNRYNYCGGDPVNRADPMGTFWEFWVGSGEDDFGVLQWRWNNEASYGVAQDAPGEGPTEEEQAEALKFFDAGGDGEFQLIPYTNAGVFASINKIGDVNMLGMPIFPMARIGGNLWVPKSGKTIAGGFYNFNQDNLELGGFGAHYIDTYDRMMVAMGTYGDNTQGWGLAGDINLIGSVYGADVQSTIAVNSLVAYAATPAGKKKAGWIAAGTVGAALTYKFTKARYGKVISGFAESMGERFSRTIVGELAGDIHNLATNSARKAPASAARISVEGAAEAGKEISVREIGEILSSNPVGSGSMRQIQDAAWKVKLQYGKGPLGKLGHADPGRGVITIYMNAHENAFNVAATIVHEASHARRYHKTLSMGGGKGELAAWYREYLFRLGRRPTNAEKRSIRNTVKQLYKDLAPEL